MSENLQIDHINMPTMQAAVLEYANIVHEGLNTAERTALESVFQQVKGKRILDLGVGAGRTVKGLQEISPNYTGVDYMLEMVSYCRNTFPGVQFEHADARALPFADHQFDLVVFSCNGISMVDHAGRLSILREVRRVLNPGGVFIFSTCNRNSSEFESMFRFPHFHWSWNPLKMGVRSLRFFRDTAISVANRLRLKKHEVVTEDYAIVNDVYHRYNVMLYFISLSKQMHQLLNIGFKDLTVAYDLKGRIADNSTRDGTLTFVAHT